MSFVGQEEKPLSASTLALSASGRLCQDCQTSFPTLPKLKYHRLKKHGKWAKKIWTCVECRKKCSPGVATKSFSNQSNLNKHLRNCHQTGPLIHSSSEEDPIDLVGNKRTPAFPIPSCHYCSYSTWDAYNLRVHIRKHTGNNIFSSSSIIARIIPFLS